MFLYSQLRPLLPLGSKLRYLTLRDLKPSVKGCNAERPKQFGRKSHLVFLASLVLRDRLYPIAYSFQGRLKVLFLGKKGDGALLVGCHEGGCFAPTYFDPEEWSKVIASPEFVHTVVDDLGEFESVAVECLFNRNRDLCSCELLSLAMYGKTCPKLGSLPKSGTEWFVDVIGYTSYLLQRTIASLPQELGYLSWTLQSTVGSAVESLFTVSLDKEGARRVLRRTGLLLVSALLNGKKTASYLDWFDGSPATAALILSLI